MRLNLRLVVVMATLAALGAAAGAAAEQSLPADLTAALTLKVLTFDRNLTERAQGEVLVAVVYAEADAGYADDLKKGFEAFADKKVNGLSVRCVTHKFVDLAELSGWMETQKVCVLFLSPGMLGQAAQLHGLAVEKKCLTAGGDARFPEKGTALGFEIADGKPKIVVHLNRSKEEGVNFAATLLQMARVI